MSEPDVPFKVGDVFRMDGGPGLPLLFRGKYFRVESLKADGSPDRLSPPYEDGELTVRFYPVSVPQ